MKAANFGPVYACIYPGLAEVTRAHGYALAAHGSMARDFDLSQLTDNQCILAPGVIYERKTN